MTMTTLKTQDRRPNLFYRASDTRLIGSYFSMLVEFDYLELVYDRQSRNDNEIWTVLVPSPRSGVLFPIGTATYMPGEADGEGPYFLGRLEDPSGVIPFKIALQDPGEANGVWVIRCNPPLGAGNGQPQGSALQRRTALRPTGLGPSTAGRAPGRAGLNGAGAAQGAERAE